MKQPAQVPQTVRDEDMSENWHSQSVSGFVLWWSLKVNRGNSEETLPSFYPSVLCLHHHVLGVNKWPQLHKAWESTRMFVTLVPEFSIGREVMQPPRGHLAMTGDIFGSHTWEGGLLASSGLRSGMLLNILWYTMQLPLQGTAWPRTSVPRTRRPARAQGSTHPQSLPGDRTTVPLRFLNLESRLRTEVMDCFLSKQPPHWHQLA